MTVTGSLGVAGVVSLGAAGVVSLGAAGVVVIGSLGVAGVAVTGSLGVVVTGLLGVVDVLSLRWTLSTFGSGISSGRRGAASDCATFYIGSGAGSDLGLQDTSETIRAIANIGIRITFGAFLFLRIL